MVSLRFSNDYYIQQMNIYSRQRKFCNIFAVELLFPVENYQVVLGRHATTKAIGSQTCDEHSKNFVSTCYLTSFGLIFEANYSQDNVSTLKARMLMCSLFYSSTFVETS